MYQYTDFDRQFVKQRAAQYRDQLERNLKGQLGDDEFRPLRLQNGWYIQRFAPMLRVAVPYGELSSAQLRVLATPARQASGRVPTTRTRASPSSRSQRRSCAGSSCPSTSTWQACASRGSSMMLTCSTRAPTLRPAPCGHFIVCSS